MTAVPIPPEPQPEDMPEQVDMSDPANLRPDLPGGDL